MAFWDKITSRGTVDDRRSAVGASGLGITGVVLLMGVTYLLGGDPLAVLMQQGPALLQQPVSQQEAAQYKGEDPYELFASKVVGSTNDTWTRIFSKLNKQYEPAELVLFRNYTESGCGGAQSIVGPHYCPVDKKIYLDETFFKELQSKFGAKGGDVAQAYVIAHEVGHHVQHQLGTLGAASEDNKHSVAVELQADCFAGLWANSIKDAGVFEFGEIQQAIDAASAVGDDNVQAKTQGTITPETWTHGSSAQRVEAFHKGYDSGLLDQCLSYTGNTL